MMIEWDCPNCGVRVSSLLPELIPVEKILAALEEVDRRIAATLDENVLFTETDDAGRRDYAVAIHALITK